MNELALLLKDNTQAREIFARFFLKISNEELAALLTRSFGIVISVADIEGFALKKERKINRPLGRRRKVSIDDYQDALREHANLTDDDYLTEGPKVRSWRHKKKPGVRNRASLDADEKAKKRNPFGHRKTSS